MSERPKVLLAGDSISMGYGPLVAEMLGESHEVRLLPENGRTSARLLDRVDEWMIAPGWDVIHFNCGLHDISRKRDRTRTATPIGDYERNLRELVTRLRAESGAALAWATTTPVIDERHHARKPFDRRGDDVRQYNAAALRVVQEAGLPVDDLHAVIESAGREECLGPDGVHMTEKGNRHLAEAVAAFVRVLAS